MNKPAPIRRLLALLPLALLLLPADNATASDVYEASWDGGQLTAKANPDFTEATIQSVSVSFDRCGTEPGEATCTWEATAVLHSPDERCNPSTPVEQVVWDSGPQSGNGTVTDGPVGFALEGCRGQSLVFKLAQHKSYEESGTPPPWIELESGSLWPLFTFGYHPVSEEEHRIINASPPASVPPFQPNFTPEEMSVASDCRSLTIGETSYVFVLRRIGCWKAGVLARRRHDSGPAPRGYACRRRSSEVLCWRRGQPQKYFEWRLPGSKPIARPPY